MIRNNKLRKQIARLYDYYLETITNMSNNFDEFKIYQRKLPYFKEYFKITEEKVIILKISAEDYFDHNLGKHHIELVDLGGAREDEEFKFTLNESLFFRKAFIDFHEATLQEIANLTESINEELSICLLYTSDAADD